MGHGMRPFIFLQNVMSISKTGDDNAGGRSERERDRDRDYSFVMSIKTIY